MFGIIKIYWLLSMAALVVFAYIEGDGNKDPKKEKIMGVEAKLEDYPFLGRLRVLEDENDGWPREWPCAAVLIRLDWVITTAYCLQKGAQGPPVANTDVLVRMALKGAEPVQDVEYVGNRPIRADRVYVHPKVAGSEGLLVNNVGLVLLERKFEVSSKINTIELAPHPIDYSKEVTMVGYGTLVWLKYGNASMQVLPPGYMKLRSLTVPLWPQSKCEELTHNSGQLCVGQQENFVWGYDIAAPLVCDNKLVGINSVHWGKREQVGVFEDIYPHKDWIEGIMDGKIKGRKACSCVRRPFSIIYLFLIVVSLIRYM